jgi:hypothetical protein
MRSCGIEVITCDITNASISENMDCVAERAMLEMYGYVWVSF